MPAPVGFRRPSVVSVAACLALLAGVVPALGALEERIDPGKRARVTTSGAVQPAARPMGSSAFSQPRVIRLNEIPLRGAGVQDQRARVEVKETRAKTTLNPPRHEVTVVQREASRRQAGQMPASIPRLDRERFERMLQGYREGLARADSLLNPAITKDGRIVSLGDINRFANPRAALEAQGIPVRRAGEDSGAEAEEVPAGTPLPIPEAKNPAQTP